MENLTPQDPQLIPPQPGDKPSWKEVGLVFLALAAIAVFTLNRLGCLKLPFLQPSKFTAGPGEVKIDRAEVSYFPRPTEDNPRPTAIKIGKAPDDRVKVLPLPGGGSKIEIILFDFILQPTIGAGWAGGSTFEPVLGCRLVKYSNIGLGPLVTPSRVGAQLDYRLGNMTGALGGAVPFNNPVAPGIFASVNVIPFN